MARADEFRELNDQQLDKRETEMREELFNLRFQVATQQTTNFARIRHLRKNIARILTLKEERRKDKRS